MNSTRSPHPWLALVGAAALSCSGGGGNNTGTPYSYNTGFGSPATTVQPATYVTLVDVTSGSVPKSCGDFAALVDAGTNPAYDQSMQIAFYSLDGGTFGTGTYAACNNASCSGNVVVVQLLADGGTLTAETGSTGTVTLTSVTPQYQGSYDVTAQILTGGSGPLHLTGNFSVPICPGVP